MLKMLKLQINVELKADPNDEDDLRNRLFDHLQMAIESDDELDFVVLDEDDDSESED